MLLAEFSLKRPFTVAAGILLACLLAAGGQYAVAQLAFAVAYIALYGGWELFQEILPIAPPEPALAASVRRLLAPTTVPVR